MINRILHFFNQPVRIGDFFYLGAKDSEKIAPKPINSPFALGKAVLDELADCKKRLDILEACMASPRTHWDGDHDDIQLLKGKFLGLDEGVKTLFKEMADRVEYLEECYFKTLTAKVSQRRLKNGRFARGR